MKKKGLFLDRDGVINVNHGYVHKIDDFQFIDGIFDLARMASEKNYVICIVTNQAGIGRGYYSEAEFNSLTDWMCARFRIEGSVISKVYHSPYHPIYGLGKYKKDHCSRKPHPGMLLEAISDYNIDPEISILVGDKISDIKAGIAAGVGTNLYIGEADISQDVSVELYTGISNLTEAKDFLKVKPI